MGTWSDDSSCDDDGDEYDDITADADDTGDDVEEPRDESLQWEFDDTVPERTPDGFTNRDEPVWVVYAQRSDYDDSDYIDTTQVVGVFADRAEADIFIVGREIFDNDEVLYAQELRVVDADGPVDYNPALISWGDDPYPIDGFPDRGDRIYLVEATQCNHHVSDDGDVWRSSITPVPVACFTSEGEAAAFAAALDATIGGAPDEEGTYQVWLGWGPAGQACSITEIPLVPVGEVDEFGFRDDGMHIHTADRLDPNGFDVNGWDNDGFNIHGFDADGIHKATETLWNEEGFDQYGYHRDTGTMVDPDGQRADEAATANASRGEGPR